MQRKTSTPGTPGKPRPTHSAGTGFTLIELLVVISIIALLVGILLPALGAARRTAQNAVCLSNERQIGIAIGAYAADNKDFMVQVRKWDNSDLVPDGIEGDLSQFRADWVWTSTIVIGGYGAERKMFQCPSFPEARENNTQNIIDAPLNDPGPGITPAPAGVTAGNWWFHSDYGINVVAYAAKRFDPAPFAGLGGNALRVFNLKSTLNGAEMRRPSEHLAVVDTYFRDFNPTYSGFKSGTENSQRGFYITAGIRTNESPDARHNGGMNILWADGHCDNFKIQERHEPFDDIAEYTTGGTYINKENQGIRNIWDTRN